MAGANVGIVRVFVSHHHSPDEDRFTARLVADLIAAGADVWVDDQGITSEDFVRKISEGLAGRQWLVLVMTPASVASPWVQREVGAALNEVTARRMLGVIPIVMLPTHEQDIPILWRPLHRYDATRSYEPARDGLLRALGLSMPPRPAAPPPPATPYQPAPVAPAPVASPTPRFPTPIVPTRLASLGYQGINLSGTPAFIPPMITIPAGPFIMGSDLTRDPEAQANETPQYWVEVGTFQIAKYTVTVAEYALAVRSGGVREPPQSGSVTWQTQQQHPDHPVVCVSWQDAMAYTAWLNKTTGQRGWRLPTEAEWEKAARWDPQRQDSRIYPWGNTFDKDRCNVSESGIRTTSPIGSYPASDARRSGASPFGVEEMAGNVWEWTSSVFKPYPYITNDGREDQKSTENRTLRGGSWVNGAWVARAACRVGLRWDFLSFSIGFRLALSPGAGSS
jgi:formylglycine-generating enzyme required for sulfatase activity